ncbi:MAG: pilus assembly protein PilP [Gammaproteobacteria bacterium]|nr:MAG: pilus assembly protein PilP [Pseudomonadota bacterium]PIE38743.1 MAG: pilus assembly protein PilP [Gammaproteobacteria bacterium]
MLAGCSTNRGFEDLDEFIAEADKKKGGPVEPLPVFEAYEAFTYSAAARRAPFSPPVAIDLEERQQPESNVKPDFDRPKELLESFPVTSLKLVGSLKRSDSGPLFALISDDAGGIHRVKEGQYMGKNHGKVVRVNEASINLIEIVTNGHGGWLERPRTLALDEPGQ